MSYHWITEKYRDSAHRDYNISVKLNHKILVVFHKLKNYDSHVIMQELGKFNLKLKVIPNVKYLSQIFDNNVLDLVKQERFYPYEYMIDFEKFKEQLPSKEKLKGKIISCKEYEHVLKV